MSDFWIADKSIIEEVNELVAEYHPEIAPAKIAVVFKEAASKKEVEAGQVCTAKLIGGIYKTLTNDTNFVILIAQDLWLELSESQRRAMLDSALESCTVKVVDGEEVIDAAGNPIYVIRPFDIVAHSSIVERHGGLSILTDISKCLKGIDSPEDSTTVNEDDYDDAPKEEKTNKKK